MYTIFTPLLPSVLFLFLTHANRYDYIILHNSVHVYPAWIERPIRKHPEVADVVVVPIPDDVNYQNICACVIRKPGSKMKCSDVVQAIKEAFTSESEDLLAPHHVLFYEAFPGNARGKIVMKTLIDDAVRRVKIELKQKEVPYG